MINSAFTSTAMLVGAAPSSVLAMPCPADPRVRGEHFAIRPAGDDAALAVHAAPYATLSGRGSRGKAQAAFWQHHGIRRSGAPPT